MIEKRHVSFFGGLFPPVAVSRGKSLALELHVKNSPVLFGCRTGVCGTCVVRVTKGAENIPPADEDELEILSLYATGQTGVRLCCQLDVQEDVELEPLCEDRWHDR